MKRQAAALLSGFVFAVGLALSGMTRPSKVLSFLNISGDWDPSLAFVMIGANAVYAATYWSSRRMQTSVLGHAFARPSHTKLDARLVIGALMFGVGWGLAGYCPGPAIVSLATGMLQPALFVAAMCVGLWLTAMIDAHLRSG